MVASSIPLAQQVGRAPSITVPLDAEQERRFQRLVEETTMIDLHQLPMVKPEDPSQFLEYLRGDSHAWGYEAVRHGGSSRRRGSGTKRRVVRTTEVSGTWCRRPESNRHGVAPNGF